jgi:hypothetical protein
MRRIVERTGTVVTTTIWKISWQEDAFHVPRDFCAAPAVDGSPEQEFSPETVQDIQQFLPVIKAKEVEKSVTKDINATNGE